MTPTASCSLGNFPLYIYRLVCLLCLARPSLPCLVLLCRVLFCPALSYDVLSALSYVVLSALCLVLSCLVLCCFVCLVSRPVLPCIFFLSCPAVFCLVLPCRFLSCFVLFCLTLYYNLAALSCSPLSCFVPPGIESTNKGRE